MRKMNWKEFLKPDRRKIVIFVILSLLFSFSFLPFSLFVVGVSTYIGFPLTIYYFSIRTGPIFSFENLILDIIVWYLLSCLIIWIYDKVKKR